MSFFGGTQFSDPSGEIIATKNTKFTPYFRDLPRLAASRTYQREGWWNIIPFGQIHGTNCICPYILMVDLYGEMHVGKYTKLVPWIELWGINVDGAEMDQLMELTFEKTKVTQVDGHIDLLVGGFEYFLCSFLFGEASYFA